MHHLSEGIINHFIAEIEKGEKQYAQLSHVGYAGEVYRILKEKHPETVMVEYRDFIFIAFTEEGKKYIRRRVQSEMNRVLNEAEKLKRYMEILGEE